MESKPKKEKNMESKPKEEKDMESKSKRVLKRWTKDEIVMAVDMTNQGFNAEKVSEELERPILSIQTKLRALRKAGLEIPPLRAERKVVHIALEDIKAELAAIEKERRSKAKPKEAK